MTRKPSLRLTLTTILLVLLLLTMGTFGYCFYRNARATADDLSAQILEQNSALVDSQVNEMLHLANEQGYSNLRMIQSGRFRVDCFQDLARYWLDMMEVHPRLTRALARPGGDGRVAVRPPARRQALRRRTPAE